MMWLVVDPSASVAIHVPIGSIQVYQNQSGSGPVKNGICEDLLGISNDNQMF
jgi:hypothetical protein